jgi:hypothetical protein
MLRKSLAQRKALRVMLLLGAGARRVTATVARLRVGNYPKPVGRPLPVTRRGDSGRRWPMLLAPAE